MEKRTFLLITLMFCFLTSCEKGYKEEIFIEKYKVIYGKWQYIYTVGETGFIKNGDYTIEFIPYGQFRYNNGKTGEIKIVEQNENSLLIDFNTLFPNVQYANIRFYDSADSMIITPVSGYPSLYIRAMIACTLKDKKRLPSSRKDQI